MSYYSRFNVVFSLNGSKTCGGFHVSVHAFNERYSAIIIRKEHLENNVVKQFNLVDSFLSLSFVLPDDNEDVNRGSDPTTIATSFSCDRKLLTHFKTWTTNTRDALSGIGVLPSTALIDALMFSLRYPTTFIMKHGSASNFNWCCSPPHPINEAEMVG